MDLTLTLLAVAGIIALLALAFLFLRASRTLGLLDTTLTALNTTLDEASETMKDLRESAMPVISKAGVTVDAINMELLRIDDIITSVEKATKKVEHTSSSITGIMNAPVDAVTEIAGRMRSAIKARRAEAQDARKAGAETTADAQYTVAEEYDI
jgi:uncharacterized protein YoxC